jgi:hypothetical protein
VSPASEADSPPVERTINFAQYARAAIALAPQTTKTMVAISIRFSPGFMDAILKIRPAIRHLCSSFTLHPVIAAALHRNVAGQKEQRHNEQCRSNPEFIGHDHLSEPWRQGFCVE